MWKFRLVLLVFIFHSSMICAAFSSAEGIDFCRPVDPERLERHQLNAANKPALLNAGEPRTVRMIYFVSDRQGFRQEVIDKMKTTIREVQRIYADQISAHGFGEKTFRYETDAQGEPIVHVCVWYRRQLRLCGSAWQDSMGIWIRSRFKHLLHCFGQRGRPSISKCFRAWSSEVEKWWMGDVEAIYRPELRHQSSP